MRKVSEWIDATQLELFLAVNLVQVVLIAIRVDEFIKWSWLVRSRCIPPISLLYSYSYITCFLQ